MTCQARPGCSGRPGSQHDDGAGLAARSTAVLRAFMLAILLVGTHLVRHPATTSYFDLVWGVAALYATVKLAAVWLRRPAGGSHTITLVIDFVLIGTLAFSSGRAFPQIRGVFIVAPIIAAIRLSPWRTAAMSAFTGVASLLISQIHPLHQQHPVVHTLFVLWSGAAAVVISIIRERREQRIIALAQARGRLVAQVIDSEERAHKRISDVLHDHVIQDLLSARQDLTDARTGDPTALDRAEHAVDLALRQLRNTIEDLDPYLLDHLSLATALRAIAERLTRRADYRVQLDIQPAACGIHDALIASLARELLSNAGKHANASSVRLDLIRRDDTIILEITDDGRGFTRAQALAALRAGHIGLASIRERLEAVDGALEIDSTPGNGTRARCLLPAHSRQTHGLSDPRAPTAALANTAARTTRPRPSWVRRWMTGRARRSLLDHAVRARELFLVFGSPVTDEEELAEVVDSSRSGWIGTSPKVQRFDDTLRD